MITKPVFSITMDADWASEACLTAAIEICVSHNVVPTVFVTNQSEVLKQYKADGKVELGVHPNFLPGSSQGSNYQEVTDTVLNLVPDANIFRSHCFYDNSLISKLFKDRGILYDSNLCLYMQRGIEPLLTGNHTWRLPVFWEDDVHWNKDNYSWDVADYTDAFFSPGLKILNLHPVHLAANCPSAEYYSTNKRKLNAISKVDLNSIRHKEKGLATFVNELLDIAKLKNAEVITMSEMCQRYCIEKSARNEAKLQDRHSAYTDEVYEKYWSLSEEERVEFVRKSYDTRNALDIYATSRDVNMRELEIESICQNISPNSVILDLGCGNGYTLLSLAKKLTGCKMTGVDFSENLIGGAKQLLKDWQSDLLSTLEFFEGDVFEHLNQTPDSSLDYVITERLVINMPSKDYQKKLISLIGKKLKSGGELLMCEGSLDGLYKLNELRVDFGLKEIPANSADNVSSIRIEQAELEAFVNSSTDLKIDRILGYSLYQLISRLIYPTLIYPENPKFDSELNLLAFALQKKTPFESGYGGNALYILKRK